MILIIKISAVETENDPPPPVGLKISRSDTMFVFLTLYGTGGVESTPWRFSLHCARELNPCPHGIFQITHLPPINQ